MNNTNFIENQNKQKLPLGRNGQVKKDPMWLHNKIPNSTKKAANTTITITEKTKIKQQKLHRTK